VTGGDVPADPAGAVLRAHELAKAFGATRAVRCANLTLRGGEIHAIVGENGSGKSTLIKMLAGVHRPDSGVIEVGSGRLRLRTPAHALAAGVATVFQEVLVAGARTVAENVWSGRDGVLRSRVGAPERASRAQKILAELLADPPALDTVVEELPLATRQACAIARALLREPRILILDEATSALDIDTTGRLFARLAQFKSAGGAVLFTSHRMDEIAALADRVTIMRDGHTVASLASSEARPDELVRLMAAEDARPNRARRRHAVARAGDVLRARGLRLAHGAPPFDFKLREGEVVGVAGLEGHGQDTFLRCLWGAPGSGEVRVVDGSLSVPVRSAAEATRRGVVYVPRDRRHEALFGSHSIVDNFSLPTLSKDTRFGLLRNSRTTKRFREQAAVLGTKFGRVTDDITTLSGGNQQKVILARWLAAEPRVLLLNDPTRGVDINVKRDLYELIDRLARRGMAAVMLSTEIDEHLALADRVLVFRERTLTAELGNGQLSRERLVAAFFGRELGGAHA
jgi:ABC-type sugar transport system ATPase subunit